MYSMQKPSPQSSRVVSSPICFVPSRERLVGEREGAARAWESSLRTEQEAARQALSKAEAREKRVDERGATLKEAEEVRGGCDQWRSGEK